LDGSVLVGLSKSTDGTEAFRWTQDGGMVGLGFLDTVEPNGPYSHAYAVSADGSVVVGYAHSGEAAGEAFRWTQDGGMAGLPVGGGITSTVLGAEGISADGTVVVGSGYSTPDPVYGWLAKAFRWTQTGGMVPLDLDWPNSKAWGISADGSVVVGLRSDASNTSNVCEAFRWTQGGGMVGLGDLPGGSSRSSAEAASADGSVVVGYGYSASGYEAFRWTQDGGMVGLGELPGGSFGSSAHAVSSDGSVVVGQSQTDQGITAFIWDETHGMRSLQDVLVSLGLGTELTGWQLQSANGISADGLTIFGSGLNPDGNPEAFRAVVVPVPGSLLLLGSGCLGLGLLGWRRRRN